MTYLSIEEDTLNRLVHFESLEEMNEHVKAHKKKNQLSKTDSLILDVISRYACKYTGVCFLSKQKIAEEANFKSRRTAIRACHRLTELGIIKQYETRRVGGDKRQSVNIILILKADLEAKESHHKVTQDSHTIKTSTKTPRETNYNIETGNETIDYIKEGLKASIPADIYKAFSPFFNGKSLYKIYGLLLRAKAQVKAIFLIEDYAEDYIHVFYNSIRLYKSGKIKNLSAYLYVAWERLSSAIDRRIAMNTVFTSS